MSLKRIAALIGLAEPTVAAIKTMTETAVAARDLIASPDSDVTALKQQIIALREENLTTKQAYLTLYNALLDLQQKEKESENFQAEAARYAMTRTEQGSTIYSLKPEHARGETPHDLCTACFNQEIKSVLQPVAHNTLKCSRCSSTYFKPDERGSGIMIASGRSTKFDGYI